MKRRLMRPSAAYFPAALLISALFGDEKITAMFLLLWLALQLTTLCAPGAFRNAAAREPGVRRVGRRFFGGLMQCILGGALFLWLTWTLVNSAAVTNSFLTLTAAAFLFIIEQMFEERMFALGRNEDGGMLSLISAILLLLGLMLDAGSGIKPPLVYSFLHGRAVELNNFYLFCGCAMAVVVSIAMSLLIARGKGFSPLPINCGFGPKAMLQLFIYPLAVFAAVLRLDASIDTRHILVGLILWQLSRTVCRRTRQESKPLDWLLTIVCAVFAAAACLHPAFLPYAICCGTAFICAAAVFLAPSVRLYVSLAVVLGVTALAYVHPFAYALA